MDLRWPGQYITGQCLVLCQGNVKVIIFLQYHNHHNHHNHDHTSLLPSHLLFFWAILFVLFGCFVTLSSWHPSRVTLMHCLSCLSRACSLAPSPLSGGLNLQVLQALPVFSHSFHTTPFTSNIGVLPGCLGGSACGFPSHLVVHVICLTHIVDFHFCRLASFHFQWQHSAYLSK